MKRFLLLSVVCLGFAVMAESPPADFKGAPPYVNGVTPGRYALCYGNVNNPVNDSKDPVIIRIDTCTGQTWELHSKVLSRDESNKANSWASIWEQVDEAGSYYDWLSTQGFKARDK